MRQAQMIRRCALVALAGLVANVGCIHNHYYGYNSPTGAGAVTVCDTPFGTIHAANTRANVGDVCEVAPGTVVSSNGTAIASNSGNSSRVLVSQPIGSSRSFGWRNRNSPENLATTKVEGAYEDDPTVVK